MENKIINLVNLPFNKFISGQSLYVKFMARVYDIHCLAEFISIKKGLVEVKIKGILFPNWYREFDLKSKYPDFIGKFRAKNCYLWGKLPGERYDRCFWFEDITNPAT